MIVSEFDSLPAHEQLMKEANRTPPLSIKQEQDLAALIKEGDRDASWVLVQHNLKFAAKMARTVNYKNITRDDLVSDAIMSLYKAAEKFEPSNHRFITYAAWWIRAGFQKLFVRTGAATNIPHETTKGLSYLRKYRDNVGNPMLATNSEIREALGVTAKKGQATEASLDGARIAMLGSSSLDEQIGLDKNSATRVEGIESGTVCPSAYIDEISRITAINEAMATLTEQEREVVDMMYFFEPALNLYEAGDVMGLSGERVRQIKVGAFNKMRRRHGDILAEALGGKYDES